LAWLQLRLELRAADVALWEARLLASGAVAVTLQDNADQPVLEPGPGQTPLWSHTRLSGLYPADTDMSAVLAALPIAELGAAAPRVEPLEDKDWERAWMRDYQPMRFGRRLWVCPSWLAPPDPAGANLLLDPGLAFGTGTHPTTALCLSQLDGMTLSGGAVVDYGCGSGILGLAALKLGAAQVLAVDNDQQALAACRDNAQRNGIDTACLEVVPPDARAVAHWAGRAQLVVANILAGPLAALAQTLCHLLGPGGTLLLSGLLSAQADTLRDRYAPWLALTVAAERGGWVCLRGERPPQN